MNRVSSTLTRPRTAYAELLAKQAEIEKLKQDLLTAQSDAEKWRQKYLKVTDQNRRLYAALNDDQPD